MKKILGVVGSPRKNGNTHVLVAKILEGAQEKGAQTELLWLDDLTIRECDGCHVCWQGKECPKNDDMNAIYPKLIDNDVIIFGTPVYWYGPTALMKGFIDRFVYFNCPEHRQKIAGKSAVIVIPFEEENPETVAPLKVFFEKSLQYLQMPLINTLIVPGVTLRGEVRNKPAVMEAAFTIGRTCAVNF